MSTWKTMSSVKHKTIERVFLEFNPCCLENFEKRKRNKTIKHREHQAIKQRSKQFLNIPSVTAAIPKFG